MQKQIRTKPTQWKWINLFFRRFMERLYSKNGALKPMCYMFIKLCSQKMGWWISNVVITNEWPKTGEESKLSPSILATIWGRGRWALSRIVSPGMHGNRAKGLSLSISISLSLNHSINRSQTPYPDSEHWNKSESALINEILTTVPPLFLFFTHSETHNPFAFYTATDGQACEKKIWNKIGLKVLLICSSLLMWILPICFPLSSCSFHSSASHSHTSLLSPL